ncbi:MAG TPA: glycosyltransferase [Thermomicrobiaceae bacterium]|nr:glycosyltransferase [Thermomicrobiaceae bacterium]
MRDRKPRVLVVTGAYPSVERPHWGTFIQSQVESLRAAGLEVEVVRPEPGFTPLRYMKAALAVWRRTLTHQVDIVHGHYGLWCLVARLQWTTPVVASFLGDDVLGTRDRNGKLTRKSLLVRQISRQLARFVDAVIVKSEEMCRALPVDAHVIPNGVNFDLFQPASRAACRAVLGWSPERAYILFGNDPAIPVKDYPLAQAAVANLRRHGMDVELVVATGLPQEELVLYLNAANVLILSSMAEGSPNIVKEAMACNVPVVATNVGDVEQVIGRTAGCAVCARDAEALTDGLERALAHEGPTTGRADIEHLDRRTVVQQVLEVYDVAGRQVRALETI